MISIIAVVMVITIALAVLRELSKGGRRVSQGFPYRKVKALFTPAERSFLGVLHQAVGNNATVFGKVRVADVVQTAPGLRWSDRLRAFNRISAKHFDFLVCDSNNLSVLCAIELNDASHNSTGRHERDEFLKGVCEAAGVPLIQVPAKSAYVISEVRSLIPRHLVAKDTPEQTPSPAPTIEKSENNRKVCPNCSTVMVKRVAKNGKHAGKPFWACKAYPKCKTIEAIGA
jgi:ssDNA-binding Zn-finger/Zn-ribbon topoisomerase 1